ncbi:MAG: S4A5 electrogenic sodium bicarbonate cotransporter 4 [Raoultibacter sp.]
MSTAEGSVRIGPISIFSLIILICLAVLSVLAVSTAQATYTSAQKHAAYTYATYENERAAQEFVSEIDAQLSLFRTMHYATETPTAAVQKILPDNAQLEDDTVVAEFVSNGGRTLTVSILIDSDGYYRILEWRASTQWDLNESNVNLWSGSTQQQ